MKAPQSNTEFTEMVQALIERWCDERKLKPLSLLLPAYVGFNGLTDGWAELADALKSVRSLGYEAFSSPEWDTLAALIRAADRALARE
jgi:hypothetical protein